MADNDFAQRIRQRYPEGLTGLFAIGATRRTYILERNRHRANPGRIDDFSEHAGYLQQRYQRLIRMFFDLGGQNMIIGALSFRSFFERGEEYAELVSQEVLRLLDDDFCAFYEREGIDPYFFGIDTLLRLPPESPGHKTALRMAEFQRGWQYTEGRRKLLWEIASIPLYTFWSAVDAMPPDERAEFQKSLETAAGLEEIYALLQSRFTRAAFGTEIPTPHFYLGTNISGDLKVRGQMPIALTGGEYLRVYYVPYPPRFLGEESLRALLEDLAFTERFHSIKTDYDGRYTPEVAEAEYQRIIALAANPSNIIGLTRRVGDED